MKRLRKLEHFGLIDRARVFTQKHAVVVLGKAGYDALCLFEKDHDLARAGELDLRDFNHDKILTDIRLRTTTMTVHQKPFRGQWKSERVLRHELGSKAVPDALMSVQGKWVAVELERTRKKSDRYQGIIQRHLNQMHAGLFARVLFVVEDDLLLRWLVEEGLPHALNKVADGRTIAPDSWRFVTLASLLAKGEQAPMYVKKVGQARPRAFTLAGLGAGVEELEGAAGA